MRCNFPVGTYRIDGSRAYRPCGKCMGCRLEYSRMWAIRCVHEASLYDENSFLTLTYNDDHLPDDRSIHKNEIQDFMRDLRYKLDDKKVRYFACGEYGKKLGRPHYHLCLFGHDFDDKTLHESRFSVAKRKGVHPSKCGDVYKSDMLQEVWKKGFSYIGEVNFRSAAYVARYVTKKINGKKQKNHYQGKEQEFALMSRMPGIGKGWIEKNLKSVYPKDFFTFKGKKLRPSRFYDETLRKMRPKMYKEVMEKRRELADECKIDDNLTGYSKERCAVSRHKNFERNKL